MKNVLKVVAEDKKLARQLAKKLLAAQTGDAALQAFAVIKEKSITQGTDDPEVVLRAKLDSLVSQFVARGELAVSEIKSAYNDAAGKAKTQQALDAALGTAAQAADTRLGQIGRAMQEAVAPLAGAYDLTDAKAALGTALSAGRAEVRLNYARSTARLSAKDFDAKLREDLKGATSEAAVVELLTAANKQTRSFQDSLDQTLTEILDQDVRSNAALAERVPEAEAYADAIRAEVAAAFGVAQAGAELAAAGAQAALGLQSLERDLLRELKAAQDNDAVDGALLSAGRRLASQTRSRNEQLDDIIQTHGLASEEGAKKTDAEKLAAQLRKSLARDIDKAKERAERAAGKRRTELEEEAANQATTIVEAARARATAAGKAAAAYTTQRALFIEEASAAADDAARAKAQAKVKELEGKIAIENEKKQAAETEATRLAEAQQNTLKLAELAAAMVSNQETIDNTVDELMIEQDLKYEQVDALHE
jgi:hypothetical protein